MPNIRSAYDQHERVSIDFSEVEMMTKQEAAAECDINNIMKRYEKTGLIDHTNKHGGNYGDFTEVQDFQISLNQIERARAMFQSIPSGIRSRFNNSPQEFLDFVSDPDNLQEMREIGLVPKETELQENKPGSEAEPKKKGTCRKRA